MTHIKNRPLLAGVVGFALVALALTGCAATSDSGGPTASGGPTSSGGTVLIVNQPAGDPFSDLVYAGVKKFAADAKISSKEIAGVQAGAYEQQIRAAAQQGMNPVMVLWDDLGKAVDNVAPSFPDTKFLVMDSDVDHKLPNVQSVVVDSAQSAYIAGIVGSTLSTSTTVGFVGGQNIPVIGTYLCGFRAGVLATKPDDKVEVVYAGTFSDPQKGQDIAASMKSSGIDVLLQAANKTGLGVLKGAAANDQLAIGADVWQGDVAPGHVPWSALKPADDAAAYAAQQALHGTFQPGVLVYGVAQGARLFDNRDFEKLTPELQKAVTAAVDGLKSGAITLTCS